MAVAEEKRVKICITGFTGCTKRLRVRKEKKVVYFMATANTTSCAADQTVKTFKGEEKMYHTMVVYS